MTEDEIVKESKQAFESALENVDQKTMERLSSARMKALKAIPYETKPHTHYWKWGGGAVVASLFILSFVLYDGSNMGNEALSEMEMLEIALASSDDIDMLEQETEFYDWLESEGVI